jgi:hypothetical protein
LITAVKHTRPNDVAPFSSFCSIEQSQITAYHIEVIIKAFDETSFVGD